MQKKHKGGKKDKVKMQEGGKYDMYRYVQYLKYIII